MHLAKKAEQARALYVEGVEMEDGTRQYPTIESLSTGTGYSIKYLRAVCAREKWREQRDRFRARIETLIREKKAKAIAEKAAQLDEKYLETAEAALEIGRKLLVILQNDIAAAEKKAKAIADGEQHGVIADDVAAAAGGKDRDAHARLSTLNLALVRSQRVAKLAIGEAADIQRHELPRGEFRIVGGTAGAIDYADNGGDDAAREG